MKNLIGLAVLASVSAVWTPRAEASCSLTGHVVTYYSETDKSATSSDPRCSLVRNAFGVAVCRIEMRGVLYSPTYVYQVGHPPPQFPAIIWNHGSTHTFDAETRACEIAEYFVPQGYHVFAPFRRGQGEVPAACIDANNNRLSTLSCPRGPNESTGMYVTQALSGFVSNATCGSDRGCRNAELLQEQVDDVVEGFDWLRARADVADTRIAVAGSSYGGIETVFFNAVAHGQRSTIAFSAGADSWANAQGVANTGLQTALKTAARNAKTPTYYMQARWDHDTRPTLELSREQINGGADDLHGKIVSATIFDHAYPATDPATGLPDYQSVHVKFPNEPEIWGLAAVDFLSRTGVE